MDSPPSFDSLTELLFRYPPASFISKSPSPRRRLASFFKADDFNDVQPSTTTKSTKLKKFSSKTYKTQETKELINEMLADMKSEVPNNEKQVKFLDFFNKNPKISEETNNLNETTHEPIKNTDDIIEINVFNSNDSQIQGTPSFHSDYKLQPPISTFSDTNDNINEKRLKIHSFSLQKNENSDQNEIFSAKINENKDISLKMQDFDKSKSFEFELNHKINDNIHSESTNPEANDMLNKSDISKILPDESEKTLEKLESRSFLIETLNIQRNMDSKPSISINENIEKYPVFQRFINNRCVSLPYEENGPPVDPSKEIKEKDANSANSPKLKKKTKIEQSFHINKWGELQSLLKNEYNVINLENELRNRFLMDIKQKHVDYYKNLLKLKDYKVVLSAINNEKSKNSKIFFEDQKKILRDMTDNIQELLLSLIKTPRIMAKMIFKQRCQLNQRFEGLFETFSKTFFEELTTEEPYQLNFFQFVDEIIKLEVDFCESFHSFNAKILGSNSLIERIFNNLLTNEKSEKYLKFLLKNPLNSLVKTSNNLEINPTKIYNKLMNRRKTENSSINQRKTTRLMGSTLLNPLTVTNSTATRSSYDNFYKNAFEEAQNSNVKEMFFQQIEDERSRFRATLTPFLSNSAKNFSYFTKKSVITENTLINDSICEDSMIATNINDSFSSNLARKSLMPPESINYLKTEYNDKNLEIIDILEKNVNEIKKLLHIFLDSIFSTIYNIPLNIRLFFKLIEKHVVRKFQDVGSDEIQVIFSNFLFLKWIIPKFTRPVFTHIGFDCEFLNNHTKNLMLLGGILHKIVKLSIYDSSASEFLCFNDFIEENKVYMKEYYEELINIGTSISDILDSPTIPSSSISIRSIFLTLEDISTICEYISSDSYDFEPVIKTLISKILAYDEQNNLFHKLFEMKGYQNLIKPSDIYLCFIDIFYPQGSFSSYQDLLFKDRNEGIFVKTKNLMRKLLISIDKVNTIYTLTGRENMHISEILEIYQEKSHIYDYTVLKTKQKIPLDTTAKFLNNCIESLENSYKINNWKRIHELMIEDYENRTIQFQDILMENKIGLSMALENLEKLNNLSQTALERYSKLELIKVLNENIIKNLKLPICLTSQEMRVSILQSLKKKIEKKKFQQLEENFDNCKIMLLNQDECIHHKLEEIGIHCFMLNEKKSIKESRKSLKKKNLGEKEPPLFHCEDIDGFVEALCEIPEVKNSIIEGTDENGINELMALYMDSLDNLMSDLDILKEFQRSERICLKDSTIKDLLRSSLEKYMTRKLYLNIFPKEPTYKDAALYSRIKVFDWIDYKHLDIKTKNQLNMMWLAATQNFKKIDLAITPISKLKSMTECFTTIIDSLTMASNKNEAAGADDSLPILIYVILKALPTRLHSDLNYIKLFCHPKRMFSQAGYSFTQIQSAIAFIQNLQPDFINVKQEDFAKIIEEKEKEHDIFFERMKNRLNEESASDLIILDKI